MRYTKSLLIVLLITTNLIVLSQITDIQWQQCFGTEIGSDSYCIENFGYGYLVGLYISEGGSGITNYHGGGDAWYIHLDSFGYLIWERCYGGTGGEQPVKIVSIDDNYTYLVNFSTSTDGDVNCENNGLADIWVVKIDILGSIIWQECYGGPDFERPRDAILTPDGGLLLMSRIFDSGGDINTFYGGYDTWLC